MPSAARSIFVTISMLRVASTAAGQLFAFALAQRVGVDRWGEGGRASIVALTSAAFFASEAICAPVGGALSDTLGARAVASRAPLLGAASMLIAGVALEASGPGLALIALIALARALEGASAGLTIPAALILVGDATREDAPKRSRWMALFEVLSLLSMIAGFALSGVLWQRVGARATLALAAVYAASSGFAHRLPRSRVEREPRAPVAKAVRAFVATRSQRGFALAWLAVNAVVGAWFQHAPVLLAQPQRLASQRLVGGYSPASIGAVFSAWGALFLSGLALWAWRFARVPRTRAMRFALVAMLGVCAMLFAFNHGAPAWTLALGAGFIVVESGFTPAALGHLADVSERDPATRGASVGLYSVLLGVGQLVGTAVCAPFVARWQMDGVLLFTVLAALLSLASLEHSQRSHRPS